MADTQGVKCNWNRAEVQSPQNMFFNSRVTKKNCCQTQADRREAKSKVTNRSDTGDKWNTKEHIHRGNKDNDKYKEQGWDLNTQGNRIQVKPVSAMTVVGKQEAKANRTEHYFLQNKAGNKTDNTDNYLIIKELRPNQLHILSVMRPQYCELSLYK